MSGKGFIDDAKKKLSSAGKTVARLAKEAVSSKKPMNQIELRKTVVEGANGALTPNQVKELVDSINDKPQEFQRAGKFDKAVNFFVKNYNRVRFKKIPADKRNTALPGEKHQPLKLPNGSLTVAYTSGPGTQLIKRIKASLAKNGNDLSKVRGLTPVDTVSFLHDVDYALAKDVDDIRTADNLMIKRVRNIAAKGLDSKYNTIGGLAIAAKISLEKMKLIARDKFADFEKLPPNEQKLLEELQKELQPEKVGFGELDELQTGNGESKKVAIKGGKKRKPRVPNKWDKHLSDYKKANPGMKLKEAMQGASKTYKK